jgi:hypothetical protein
MNLDASAVLTMLVAGAAGLAVLAWKDFSRFIRIANPMVKLTFLSLFLMQAYNFGYLAGKYGQDPIPDVMTFMPFLIVAYLGVLEWLFKD